MVTVNMFNPYYVKISSKYIHVLLEEKCFTITIEDKQYEFVPDNAKEIKIDRKTKKIVNTEAIFAFYNEDDTFYITMKELIDLPDFLIKLYFITKPYMEQKKLEDKTTIQDKTDVIIDELERMNVKRLIDKALDERDEETFKQLLKKL
ncbi:IDEAL domain-containing protein [Ornithinibacillus halophilus]|uniref:IDEAL domain-containing protein n=1 Tax=Ornithinibacillus halophilus TaxID=930117 RepID=A0A1M5FE23_9BACI|nr:IDEAL domain-containing protein [Ornithinibacillus halophilus]SHF89773.1 IDEAL domain-containing protein [Ornithinibacillus halophilus]